MHIQPAEDVDSDAGVLCLAYYVHWSFYRTPPETYDALSHLKFPVANVAESYNSQCNVECYQELETAVPEGPITRITDHEEVLATPHGRTSAKRHAMPHLC